MLCGVSSFRLSLGFQFHPNRTLLDAFFFSLLWREEESYIGAV
jgi:hypothetical protein